MEKTSAARIVRQTFQNPFNKESFVYFIKSLLNHIEPAPFIYRGNFIPDAYEPYIKTLERIGKYQDKDGKKIDLLIVRLKKETSLERARTMQRNFIAWYLNGSRGDVLKDAALVAFVSPDLDDWRFSLVKMDYRLDTSGEKVRVKQDLTPARRFSFLVGKTESSHTAQSRLVPILQDDSRDPTLQDLEEAFSIEKVIEEFFKKYRQLFHEVKEALDEVIKKDKKVQQDFKEKNIDTVNFAKKLLGQIVFLYFLQKKGWFGVERDKDWGTGPKNFLRLLFEKEIANYDNFFNEILEPLFYEALAVERTDNFYSRFNCKIPFLNGGLFDPFNNYDWVHTDILLPNELFSNNIKTKEGDIGTGILDIFDRYNFTVKEDEPLEKEVAVDPEMLGKVFENLLEVKDRKSKGTYYTPRDIVHYMCQQSLVNYLKTECNDIEGKKIESLINPKVITKKDYQKFRKTGGRKEQVIEGAILLLWEKEAEELDKKLKTIRICDPACGSGAFLVGMMQEIISARKRLNFILNKEIDPYELKRHAIQSCLYGVDIDPGAVEIAKLRLWLSLIVDEEDIKRIKPLPNLDYKIMQGNSLIELLSEEFLRISTDQRRVELINKFKKAKDELFNISSSSRKRLKRQEINELIKELFEYDRNLIIKSLKQEIKGVQNQGRLFTDARFKREDKTRIEELKKKIEEVQKIKIPGPSKHFEWHINFSEVFQEKSGFDVVIANPPYIKKENLDSKTIQDLEEYYTEKTNGKIKHWSDDLYVHFIFRGFEMVRNEGILSYITNDSFISLKSKLRVRSLLLKNKLLRLIRCPAETFQATIYTAVFVLQKSLPNNDYYYHSGYFSYPDFQYHDLGAIPYEVIHTLPDNRLIFAHPLLPIYKRLAKLPKLKEYLRVLDTGIHSGNVREKIFFRDKVKDNLYRLLQGKQIERYGIFWNRSEAKYRYCDIYYKPKHQKGVGRKGGKSRLREYWHFCGKIENHHQPERLLMRQSDDDLVVAYQNESEMGRFYTDNTLFTILPINNKISLKYAMALLNSKLLNAIYHFLSQEEGKTLAQIKIGLVNELPFILGNQKPFIELVDKILSITKSEDYLQNPSKQAKVKECEKQIDQLVYKLYGLTPGEIKIIENYER